MLFVDFKVTLRLYAEMKPTVKFTACGFFTIGYSLVTSVSLSLIPVSKMISMGKGGENSTSKYFVN